jgi:amino acid adenylation domain-containing protein
VGDFTSLTLLEVDYSIPQSFSNHAQQLQQQLWQDLDNGYISGLQVQRELSRQRQSYQFMPVVFTSTLGLESLGQDTSILSQLGEIVYSISQTPQVWLDNQIREQNGTLIFNWDAVEELFPAGLLDEMFAAYCDLLQRLITSDTIWSESQGELRQPTIANYPTAAICEETLHSLFIKQVQIQADSLAVITPERTLTYRELYQRAVQLASQLRELGASSDNAIAIIMKKGWEQVVAVLGILIAGAAYLPIDPELPPERQWYLITQGQVKLIVTQPHLHLSLPSGVQQVCVESQLTGDEKDIKLVQTSDDLAYIIYTSGSTGLPKGVMIDHRGAVNTILDINRRFGVRSGDRILALSALNFDLSVYDIFGMLAVGGTIVIPSAEQTKDPAHWLELIVSQQITLWNSVPALMQMLVEYLANQPQPSSLRLALLSGDWLPLNLPNQIQTLWSNIQVVSLGGATEASIWSIYYPITQVNPTWKSIPYGKPLDNQKVYVFNHNLQQTPVWVTGQLYIGGIGLAKGYWKDAEKTNASFITHPVTKEKLYKTGDLGRYLPDGNIEFLGREDFQVKINGYRIELGEIEAILKQHSTVKEAVVTTVEQTQQLVAYIVSNTPTPNLGEAYQPSQQEGVLSDAGERIEFKLQQPGIRKSESSPITIHLPKSELEQTAYLQRQSYRQFLPQQISLEQFSKFLNCLQQMQLGDYPLPKYRYPSAGSLYPVQTYLFIKPNSIENLPAGIYYYHPSDHNLILLHSSNEIDSSVYLENQALFQQSAFAIYLIGKLSAIAPMYGELARDFCLLEAGHIGQLLMNSAPTQEIGLCPLGYLEFTQIQDLFQLETNQILLYNFVGGKIDLTDSQQWSILKTTKSNTTKFREYLQQKLPQYMIPAEYIFIDTLPLTPNGKIDRKALPTPNLATAKSATLVPPQTQTEKTIAEFIQQLLQIETVGIQHNFFELGIDSLKLVQLKNHLQNQLQVNIPMRQLLIETTNIQQLALAIDEQLIIAKITQRPLSTEQDDDKEIIQI